MLAGRNQPTSAMLFILTLLFLLVATQRASAVAQEWFLHESALESRTTNALLRYYSIVEQDSLQVRYVRNTAGATPYRLRAGNRTPNDTLGQLLSLSLGQLTLFSVPNLRIALGDDLYTDLLLSRYSTGTTVSTIYTGNSFGHDDWQYDYRTAIALDRVDIRINPKLSLFAALGAPESNLYWWSDGTARLGFATPQWEFAGLLPLASGGTAVGPFRQRLLAPGFGASAMVHMGNATGRLRFTALSDIAFEATSALPRRFVHTLSGQAYYRHEVLGTFGTLWLDGGIGYEEFTLAKTDTSAFSLTQGGGSEVVPAGRVRRLSPIAEVTLSSPSETLQVRLGIADIALRGSIAARLNENLWLELTMASNDIFRDRKDFEHPFQLFLTPRIKF